MKRKQVSDRSRSGKKRKISQFQKAQLQAVREAIKVEW